MHANTQYQLAIKMSEVLILITRKTNLENIMLSEKSQTQKNIYCMIVPHEMPRIGRYIEPEID